MTNNKRPKMKRPAPVTDLLTALLRGTPAELRLKEGRIWEVWDEAVGDKIAAHAQPATFREGTLTLHVDSPPWLQQLTYLKKELISKVNEALDQELVKEIQLKSGKVRKPSGTVINKPARRELSAEEQAWAKEQAESAADPELRAIFESLIRKDREHQKKD